MTTETYDFLKDTRCYFKHLLLESNADKINMLTGQEGFDSSNLTVKLEVNGITLRVEDFNDIMENWGSSLISKVEEKWEYNQSEKAVIAKAEELIKGKLANAYEALSDIENSLWKLKD